MSNEGKDIFYAVENPNAKEVEISLIGFLSEDSTMPSANVLDGAQKLTVDFSRFHAMNSSGIKKWIFFIDQVKSVKDLKVEFKACPSSFLRVARSVTGVMPPDVEIISYQVPIYCEKCDIDFSILQSKEKLKENIDNFVNSIETLDCETFPKCKANLTVDCNTNLYSYFLESN